MEELGKKQKIKITPLGYIVFTILITLCVFVIVNFFVGGIPWQIVLAGVVLGLILFTIR